MNTAERDAAVARLIEVTCPVCGTAMGWPRDEHVDSCNECVRAELARLRAELAALREAARETVRWLRAQDEESVVDMIKPRVDDWISNEVERRLHSKGTP